jgi:hypothetical protein
LAVSPVKHPHPAQTPQIIHCTRCSVLAGLPIIPPQFGKIKIEEELDKDCHLRGPFCLPLEKIKPISRIDLEAER